MYPIALEIIIGDRQAAIVLAAVVPKLYLDTIEDAPG